MRTPVLLLILALSVPACTDKPDTGDTGDVDTEAALFTGITTTPTTVGISVGQTEQLTVLATYDDGTTQDVTGASEFRIVNASVATVTDGGLVTALSGGRTEIEVEYLDESATVQVNIGEGSLEGTVEFGGYPVQGAIVTLSGGATGDTVTDANGDYAFDGLPADDVTVTVSLDAVARGQGNESDLESTIGG